MTGRQEGRPARVPSQLYSEEIVVRFAGPDYRDFIESHGRRLRPRLARSLELAQIRPGARLLDLGCGRGEVAVHAALRGARVTAVDYSADCVRLTREAVRLVGSSPAPPPQSSPARGEERWTTPSPLAGEEPALSLSKGEDGRERPGAPPSLTLPHKGGGDHSPPPLWGEESAHVQVCMADATELPFADETFDRATLLDVVEHLFPWQLDLAMREVRRVLKPDGFAVIHTVPNRWALSVGYSLLRLVRPSLPADPRTEYEHAVHVNEQDIIRLGHSLRAAGFRSRVWLENLTIEQARWQQNSEAFRDVRGATYGFFRNPVVRGLARLALRTPLRLIACNDIYAVAWPR